MWVPVDFREAILLGVWSRETDLVLSKAAGPGAATPCPAQPGLGVSVPHPMALGAWAHSQRGSAQPGPLLPCSPSLPYTPGQSLRGPIGLLGLRGQVRATAQLAPFMLQDPLWPACPSYLPIRWCEPSTRKTTVVTGSCLPATQPSGPEVSRWMGRGWRLARGWGQGND